MTTEEGSTVKLRSIYVSSPDVATATHDAESQSGLADGNSSVDKAIGVNGDDDSKEGGEEDDIDASEPEPLQLPESTHSLFFTQPVCSTPFLFALSIVVISIMCLVMALINNLQDVSPDNPMGVPANVTPDIRIAQYLAILIALLMEEEIPTGIHLLRMIPSSSFKKKFPNKDYRKFVAAAALRIVLGYIFLGNVFIILAQANGVLDIFYDVLALQFISELDDIAFSLAKIDVLGKRLQRACTAKLFQTEFEKQKFGRSKKASIFLKSIYFLNLGLFLAGMIFVSVRQTSGFYQCDSIKVDFGDVVWEDAVVVISPGQYEERILVFSTFNGVYVKSGTLAGRPVYQERKKVSIDEPFSPEFVVPAEIKYDIELGCWVFTHPNIRQSEDEPGWLLRSPETTEYDLLNVGGDWSIWNGVIDSSRLTYTCNQCNDKTECNLNGECVDGKCVCKTQTETEYLGTHCEVKLKSPCTSIISEGSNITSNVTFSVLYLEGKNGRKNVFQEYNRPVYQHVEGLANRKQGDLHWVVYTGRRWAFFGMNPAEQNKTQSDVIASIANYHAFWHPDFSFSAGGIVALSDPTTKDTPVGVDWYSVGERGDQFGPFGALDPLQKDGQVGRGFFRCVGEYVPLVYD